jgi:type II secretory pathway pseudopilin PulG
MPGNPYEVLTPQAQENKRIPEQPVQSGWVSELCCVVSIVAMLMVAILPVINHGRHSMSRRPESLQKLRVIGLALHNYYARHQAFPPTFTIDENGHRMHSWRTLLLRDLGRRDLDDCVDWSKPWHDIANAETVQHVEVPFSMADSHHMPRLLTRYLAISVPGGGFNSSRPQTWKDLHASADETVMVVEVPIAFSVPWMSTNDSDEDSTGLLERFAAGSPSGVLNVLYADGSTGVVDAREFAETVAGMRVSLSAAGESKEF